MRPLALAALAALLGPGAVSGQAKAGINQNFIAPGEATRRQEEHNHYFLSRDPQEVAQILDLQTSAYALAERPAGLTYDTYSAIAYGLATSMMVVGPRTDADGNRRVVIIDTLEDGRAGRTAAADFLALYNRKYGASLTKLPIDAIIYTHNHIDHTGGVLGFLEMADKEACPMEDPSVAGADGSYIARRNCVEIICQEGVTDAVVNTSTVSGQIIQARSIYMYGISLDSGIGSSGPGNVGKAITNGIGPFLSKGLSGFRMPSRTFTDQLDLSAAGVAMEVVYVPSETNDELAVFVPDAENGAAASVGKSGLLFSAEVVQGPAFPNLYSLRGTQYRSPKVWFESVDKLRDYDSWCMVPSHGPPVCQRKNIQLLLTNFRDAIQFTHDQTLRFMNMGYTPDELVERVKVPDVVVEDLKALVAWPNAPGNDTFQGPVRTEDYLLPFYGSVPQGVRETYFGYVGWYDADPVNLDPIPPAPAAVRMIALVDSGKSLSEAAGEALAGQTREDFQWAAELATILIRAKPDDLSARKIKAEAFRKLGARAIDPNWSDWFFTAANELDNAPGTCFIKYLPAGLVSPVIQAAVPIADWVDSWTWHLDGQKAARDKAGMALGFWFEPTNQDFGSEGYVLQLRHGIVEVTAWQGTKAGWLEEVDVALQMSQKTLDELIVANSFIPGKVPPLDKVTLLKGTAAEAERFAGYFDGLPACEPALAVPRR